MRRSPLIAFLVLAIVAILAVASCSGADPTSTPVPVPPTEAAQPDPTAPPEPTEPPAATMAPAETATPFPTVTPFPTLTPTAEPGATPTPTAAPRATATPEPTTAPTAAPRPLGALSSVENDLFGFAIDVPEAWALDEGSVLVRASDPEFGIPRLTVEVLLPAELGTNEDYGQIALGLLESAAPEVVSEGAVTFDDGTEGYGYVLNVTAETALRAHLYVVGRGSQVYQVFVGSVPGDFDARADEFEAIAKSFRFRDPAPFGARLDRSLVMQSITPSRLDPHLIENITSYRFAAQIFGGLVRLDRDLRVVPAAAESWDISDDGLVYDFHLHPDAVFHSGKPVTPEDVKWSFERAADPATGSRVSRLYIADIEGVDEKLDGEADEISGIEIIDEDTIRFTLTDPVPYFLAKMTHTAAFILNRENVEAGGETWALTPDGTGPFKVRGWTPGIVLVLDRHEAHHLGAPTVESVVIWLYGNPLLRYQAGELDVASVGALLGEEVRDPEHPLNAELKNRSQPHHLLRRLQYPRRPVRRSAGPPRLSDGRRPRGARPRPSPAGRLPPAGYAGLLRRPGTHPLRSRGGQAALGRGAGGHGRFRGGPVPGLRLLCESRERGPRGDVAGASGRRDSVRGDSRRTIFEQRSPSRGRTSSSTAGSPTIPTRRTSSTCSSTAGR